MTNKLKLILTSDSDLTDSQIKTILCSISGIEISAIEKDLGRASELIKIINPDVLVFSVNRLNATVIDKLKSFKKEMTIIILSSNMSFSFSNQLKEAGANYVFDLALQLHNFIDVLCELLYQRQLKYMLSNKVVDNFDPSQFDASI